MSRYSKGARLERRVKKLLENLGFFVVRSAGSRGPFDLVAFKCIVFGIQVKTHRYNITVDEKDVMLEVANRHNIIPLFAVKDGRKIVFLDHHEKEVNLKGLLRRIFEQSR